MQSKERIEYVTRHFAELQGLRIIPFALYLLAGAAYDATWSYPGHRTWGMGLLWLIGVGSLLAYARLGSYYRHHFGNVQPRRNRRQQRLISLLFISFLVLNIALGFIDRVIAERYHSLLVGGWWLLLAVVLLAIWGVAGFPLGWPRRFSMWPILLLLVSGSWNLPGAPSQEACYPNGFNLCVAFDLLLATAIAAGGYYNHRLLIDTLQPLPRESHG